MSLGVEPGNAHSLNEWTGKDRFKHRGLNYGTGNLKEDEALAARLVECYNFFSDSGLTPEDMKDLLACARRLRNALSSDGEGNWVIPLCCEDAVMEMEELLLKIQSQQEEALRFTCPEKLTVHMP